MASLSRPPSSVSPGGRPPGTPRGAIPGGRPPGTPRGAIPGGRPPGTPRGAIPGGRPPGTPRGAVWSPAVLLRDPQPGQRGLPRGLPGRGLPVGVAGQDHRRLAPSDQPVGAPCRCDVLARPQAVDELPRRLRRLVVEELPVHHHDGGVIAGRVALDPLHADFAVASGLVALGAEMLA